MSESYSICPDCGANVAEFVLHKDNCPKFGQELTEFLERREAEIASWPESAREELQNLSRMQAALFGRQMRLRRLLASLVSILPDRREWTDREVVILQSVLKELGE